MSEYEKDYKDQIYSDFALRLGKITERYDALNGEFEVTLYICVLQNLLTNCVEGILRSKDNKDQLQSIEMKSLLAKTIDEKNSPWNLELSFIKTDTFKDVLTVGNVIEKMRNALSHPAQINIDGSFPSSGYTTIPSDTKTISEICFINSPDVRKNRPRLFNTEKDAKDYVETNNLEKLGLVSIRKQTENNCYGLFKNEKPFARIFRIDLPVDNLRKLITELSRNLSMGLNNQDKTDDSQKAQIDEVEI